MKNKIRQKLKNRKRRLERRLARARRRDTGMPVIPTHNASYELSERIQAIDCGGMGAAIRVAQGARLAEEIDSRVEVLKFHRPYHESDHVMTLVLNALTGGRTLNDVEYRRCDEAFLNALDVESVPDPTTLGDFCRRFSRDDLEALQEAINNARLNVWSCQPDEFLQETARIDVDSSIVETTGKKKHGASFTYNKKYGYHPLIVSLANTGEPLLVINRSGNEHSAKGSAPYLDKAITLCRKAGFGDVLLRGDNAFCLTSDFDRWTQDNVRFVFGYKGFEKVKKRARNLEDEEYEELILKAECAFAKPRKRAADIKRRVIKKRGYKHLEAIKEEYAEFDYLPGRAKGTYRMVVLRKLIRVSGKNGQGEIFEDQETRYFFYVTNDYKIPAEQVIKEIRQRCNQENLIEQLKNGVRALHAPLNTLNANAAYMICTAAAWSLKAWMALGLPVHAAWKAKHLAERKLWLRMEFRRFVNEVIRVPTQILTHARQRIFRFLAYKPQLPVLFRLLNAL